ncbi:MAG: nucleoside-diphosphate sugar epimerase/dehydratase [Acidimicrobiia bacterium]
MRGRRWIKRGVSRARTRTHLRLYALDAVLIATSYAAVLLLRFDGAVPNDYWKRFLAFLPFALLAHLASNTGWGLYRQMWRHASVQEARRVLLAGVTVVAIAAPLYFVLDARPVPVSVLVLGALVATALAGLHRFQGRLVGVRRRAATPAGLRVLVIGAGEAGAAIVREMQRKPAAGLNPVAVLDDDLRKQGLALLGVPIAGETSDLGEVVERDRIQRALLAIPTAGQELVRRVATAAEEAGVPLQVVPELGDLIAGRVSLRDVRDLRIEDLMGRQQAKTDLEAVRCLLAGRRVLITGGGGSIGAELARQVAECSPASLVLVDNDETHLHDATASLTGPVETALCDIRSASRLVRIFERHRPEVVFHAAALKHVPVLEDHACEAIETNVLGTDTVLKAAARVGVQRLVFISTDKAVRPTSVMGASKWLAEQLVLACASESTPHCAVRFGNVVGSRGSVIPTFSRQIAAGGPVTVTDPEMTRYFMSIEEAVQLVLQAAVFATGSGEVFMLEMGEPVNILALAQRMIMLSGFSVGEEIEIDIVGARPGEKLTEELRAPDERCEPTPHESIVRHEPRILSDSLLDETLEELTWAVARDDEATARKVVSLANGADAVLEPDLVIDLTVTERSKQWNPSSI